MSVATAFSMTQERDGRPDETKLGRLVLEKALRDAYTAKLNTGKGFSSSMVMPEERAEARRFCEAETGEWAEARREWCYAAGIEPEVFEEGVAALRDRMFPPAMAAE